MFDSPLTRLLLVKLSASVARPISELTKEQLHEGLIQCIAELSPYPPESCSRILGLVSSGEELRSRAEKLLHAPAAADWCRPIDRTGQVWISRSGRAPDPGSFNADLSSFGADLPKPRGGLWTSSRIGALTSGWISYLQDGPEGYPPPYHPWLMHPDVGTRIYEIADAASWHFLSSAYPGSLRGRLAPDWTKVAQDWDAVHLTTQGLLLTYGVTSDCATALQGWDCESTLWLRWSFPQVVQLPVVTEEHMFRSEAWMPFLSDIMGDQE